MLFLGYYKDPVATAAAFTEDGYFRTGDKATIDSDGFITIIDRINSMIKTSSGQAVAPHRVIEAVMRQVFFFAPLF